MTKTVTHIDCPKEWESDNDWDSHRPLLWLSMINSKDAVIELGSGEGSTNLIREYCKENDRKFNSYDSNKEYSEKYNSEYIYDWNNIVYYPYVGLLFVDHAPADNRNYWLWRMPQRAQVIIAHDTEDGAEYVYHMADALSKFKYRLDYQPEGKPHTTAVSNFIDVTKWVE